MFPITPWLWAYCPVWTVTREGQQSDIETYALLNGAPAAPISPCVCGIAAMSRTVSSSVVNMIMFGLVEAAREDSPRAITATAITHSNAATTAPALAVRVRLTPCMDPDEHNERDSAKLRMPAPAHPANA